MSMNSIHWLRTIKTQNSLTRWVPMYGLYNKHFFLTKKYLVTNLFFNRLVTLEYLDLKNYFYLLIGSINRWKEDWRHSIRSKPTIYNIIFEHNWIVINLYRWINCKYNINHQEIPLNHIWNERNHLLHCSFTFEMYDLNNIDQQFQFKCRLRAYQSNNNNNNNNLNSNGLILMNINQTNVYLFFIYLFI